MSEAPVSTPHSSHRRLTIAAVYAHPDDGEFWAGGALARWAEAGHRVLAICCTDGALGMREAGGDALGVATTRHNELHAALSTLGGEAPVMLGFQDGFLHDNQAELRERLIYQLRRLRPDRIVTFDPWARYEVHPDHVTAGRMASEAACFAGFPLLHPEHLRDGIEPFQPSEVWFMGPLAHKPNRVVDITTTLAKKLRATLSHTSQIAMLADWFVKGADPTRLTDDDRKKLEAGCESFLDGMGRGTAMAFGGRVEIAECFYALKTGPGHFDNQQTMIMEMLGMPPEEPLFE